MVVRGSFSFVIWVKAFTENIWQIHHNPCGGVDAKSSLACWDPAHSYNDRLTAQIVRKFPDLFFPSWNSGWPIVEVTPTVSHKHSLTDCLPSQCWHWRFPSLSGGLIFMYFHCNYMAVFLDFQNALVSPHWLFSSTTADQTELLPTLCFSEPLRIKPTSKQKIKHQNESWRGGQNQHNEKGWWILAGALCCLMPVGVGIC